MNNSTPFISTKQISFAFEKSSLFLLVPLLTSPIAARSDRVAEVPV
jgi:hypothetical protein